MGRFIPNANTWIGFSATAPATLASPTETEIAAATDITKFVVTLNASAQGNTVPTPDVDSLFETSVVGTSQAQFQVDCYRDDEDDVAWDMLPRGQKGVFFVSRYGGTGENQMPAENDNVEVWPVQVSSRAASAITSNTVQTFTVTTSVPTEPVEDAVVVAAGP